MDPGHIISLCIELGHIGSRSHHIAVHGSGSYPTIVSGNLIIKLGRGANDGSFKHLPDNSKYRDTENSRHKLHYPKIG